MTIFDERKAIEMVIQELKEQTRMDFEVYLESRRARNEQINILLDRLRQLDEREKLMQLSQNEGYQRATETMRKAPDTVEEWLKIKEERLRLDKERKLDEQKRREFEEEKRKVEELKKSSEERKEIDNLQKSIEDRKLKEKREAVAQNIQVERINKRRGKQKRVPLEKVEPLVIKYISEQDDTTVHTKYIKAYVEGELGVSWSNFGEVMRQIVERNNKVKKAEKRGYYSVQI